MHAHMFLQNKTNIQKISIEILCLHQRIEGESEYRLRMPTINNKQHDRYIKWDNWSTVNH